MWPGHWEPPTWGSQSTHPSSLKSNVAQVCKCEPDGAPTDVAFTATNNKQTNLQRWQATPAKTCAVGRSWISHRYRPWLGRTLWLPCLRTGQVQVSICLFVIYTIITCTMKQVGHRLARSAAIITLSGSVSTHWGTWECAGLSGNIKLDCQPSCGSWGTSVTDGQPPKGEWLVKTETWSYLLWL